MNLLPGKQMFLKNLSQSTKRSEEQMFKIYMENRIREIVEDV